MLNQGSPTPKTPVIARAEWPKHPHYPAQVLLLGSHKNFRAVSEYLATEAETHDDPARLESLYRQWIGAMRSHEAYEENKLYPYLAWRWDVSFASAEAGHVALHERHADVLSAFSAIRTDGLTDATRSALMSALRAHDEILRAHLEVEEDLVIPLLLALSPDEFRTYSHSTMWALKQRMEAGRPWES